MLFSLFRLLFPWLPAVLSGVPFKNCFHCLPACPFRISHLFFSFLFFFSTSHFIYTSLNPKKLLPRMPIPLLSSFHFSFNNIFFSDPFSGILDNCFFFSLILFLHACASNQLKMGDRYPVFFSLLLLYHVCFCLAFLISDGVK